MDIRRLLFSAAILCALGPLEARAQTAGILPCNAASLSVSNTSSNVQLSKCAPSAIIMNIGSTEAFYNFGATSAAAATTSNYSIPANSWQLVVVGTNGEWIAAITASSTTTLRILQGTGL
jgi:hypothetical protein